MALLALVPCLGAKLICVWWLWVLSAPRCDQTGFPPPFAHRWNDCAGCRHWHDLPRLDVCLEDPEKVLNDNFKKHV